MPARLILAISLATMLAACAGTQSRNTDPVHDPWEGFNRKMYAFNQGLDKVARPIAKGYDKIMPDPLQRGVTNFMHNLAFPVTFVNALLQGKPNEAGVSAERFLMNTVFGLFGFFDLATKAGIEDPDEDFGQTLAVWGWHQSRYLVVPILGPLTARDVLGRGYYGYLHPLPWYAREQHVYWPIVLDLLNTRANLLPYDEQIDEAYDPYVFVRDAYLQNREFHIYDGNPPVPDYESYLEGQ